MSKLKEVEKINDYVVLEGKKGTRTIIQESNIENERWFIALVAEGHIGKGFYYPGLQWTTATRIEDAKYVIENRNRVKRNGLIGIWEADELRAKFVNRVSQVDPFIFKNPRNELDMDEERVILPQAVEYEDGYKNDRAFNPAPKLHESEVKTADQYPDNMPLQRYVAPIRVNGSLEFNRNINFEDMMAEYIYYNTIKYGRRDSTICSFYLQIYGEPNPLNMKYHPSRNTITWVHPEWQKTITVDVHELNKPHLEQYEQNKKIKQEEKAKKEWTSGRQTQEMSTIDRFRARQAKSQAKRNSPTM